MIQNKLKSLTIITLLLFGYSPYIINGGVSATTINMSTSMNEPNIKEEDEEEEDTETNAEDNVIDSDDEEIIINSKDGKEEIFEVPEGMIIDVEKMMSDFNNKQYLTVDTACDMRDINPVFEQEVYIDRLKRMPTAMEMPWNEVVQRFIDRYSGRLRKSVSFMLGASNFYMPIFEQALEVYGLPLELKYLPVIESALNPNAVSRVGATGLWQFMAATGKRYGLKLNSMIDERRDPLKASYAAAHYLSDLYGIFEDWNLVIAAYNAGPANIQKAIQRAGGVKDYWQIYPYLPTETRGYVPAFIAANYIMHYYCEHNICPMLTTLPAQTDTIMLYQNVHFEQVANVLGISIEELRSLNPQYRRDVVTGYTEPTDLRLPVEYISKYIANEDSILAYNVDQLMKRDMVEVNDNAPAYRSTRKSSTSYKSKKSTRTKRSKRGRGGSTISIRNGDTLEKIAKRHGTTVAKLKKLNKISGSNIRAGKKLKVR
nr:lytic transglycosylase [uncultured Prevotella sp.]